MNPIILLRNAGGGSALPQMNSTNVFLNPVFVVKVAKLKEMKATGKSVDPGINRCCPEHVQKTDWQDIIIYIFGSVKVADQRASSLNGLQVIVDEFEEAQ